MTNDKLTPKQLNFALGVAEGKSQSEAYRDAYNAENMSDDSIKVEASRLVSNPNISLTIANLRKEAKERTLYTMEKAMNELEELRILSIENGQYATAISAVDRKAKLNGLYDAVKIELSGKGGEAIKQEHALDMSQLTDDQLRAVASICVEPVRE